MKSIADFSLSLKVLNLFGMTELNTIVTGQTCGTHAGRKLMQKI